MMTTETYRRAELRRLGVFVRKWDASVYEVEIGSRLALQQISYDYTKFVERGGVYNMNVVKSNKANKVKISGEVASGKTSIGKL